MGAPQPQETPIAFIAYTYSFYSLRPLMRLFLLIHALIRHGKILIQGRIDTSMSQLDSHTDGDYRNAAVPQLLNGPGPLLFVHNITAIQHDSIHLRSVRFFSYVPPYSSVEVLQQFRHTLRILFLLSTTSGGFYLRLLRSLLPVLRQLLPESWPPLTPIR